MSLEGYSNNQIIEEIERRMIDRECDLDVAHTTIEGLHIRLAEIQTEVNAAYQFIDFLAEFLNLAAFDNVEYHFYRKYRKARYGEGNDEK